MFKKEGFSDEWNNEKKGQATFWMILFLCVFFIIGGAFALYYFKGKRITTPDIAATEKIMGLRFTSKEREMLLDNLKQNLRSYQTLRGISLENHVPPALTFNPIVPGASFPSAGKPYSFSPNSEAQMPDNLEDLAFYPITSLALLIKTRQVTSTQLTELYLRRLKKFGPILECVITLTEELALKQARRADEEIASGNYRGPLHGIPWGAKDLLATKGIKTTWGAVPFKDQLIEYDATVVERLNKAGAVLVAKLSMGALAWGDVWFGGKTRNPWNLEQGSSGSSAGSAAAFDELTRSGRDDLLVRQLKRAWPNVFRQARFIPAVEYIQANRVRTILMQEMFKRMRKIDVYVAPSFGNSNLLLTNLTGHPTVVAPNGFDQERSPTSISFIGDLFQEAKILRLAKAFQDATIHHLHHPELKENF